MFTKEDEDVELERLASQIRSFHSQLNLKYMTEERREALKEVDKQISIDLQPIKTLIKEIDEQINTEFRPIAKLCQDINHLLNEQYKKKPKETEVLK